MDIIEMRDISYRYPASQKFALQDVSLHIRKGEFCAIIGANGSGKTTLCNVIRGFAPHFYKGEIDGDVFINGQNTRYKTIADLSNIVGIVIQNPFTQLSGMAETVYEELAFGLENLGVQVQEICQRVEDMLKLLKFEELKDKNPFELSGGQQQLLSLASIMVMKPDILILDEPTSQLDPQSTEKIFQTINLFRRNGTTILLVEHKMEFIAKLADHIIVLYDGKIVLDGRPAEIFSNADIINYNINLPVYAHLAIRLIERGFHLDYIPITENQAISQVNKLLTQKEV
jgi:energy-coupling factor transport system ATP-binding protein